MLPRSTLNTITGECVKKGYVMTEHISGGCREMYLRPDYRGRGVASGFFRWLKEHLPAARYRLEAEANNKGAIALYRRLGYDPLNYLQFIKEPRE